MKNLILFVIVFLISFTLSAQTKLYKGLYAGMTRREAQAEFKKHKDQYTVVKFGLFQYRLFMFNNQYDNEGKLFQIGFVENWANMRGVQSEGIDRLRDFVRFAKENGYTSDGVSVGASEFQFDKNGQYLFISPEKDKFIKLTFSPDESGSAVATIWIGSYSMGGKNVVYKTNDF